MPKFLDDIIVDGSAKLGIGTASPSYKLDVSGNVNISGTGGFLRFNSGDVAVKNEGSYKLGFQTYNSTSSSLTTKMVLDTNGNVGIGTSSPSRNLVVSNTSGNSILGITSSSSGLVQLALGDTDDDNYGQIILDNSSNKLQIQNGGGSVISNRGITLDSSENVGIGTSSPASELFT